MFQGALVSQWIPKLLGLQVDIRQKALESMCISNSFVLLAQLRERERERESKRWRWGEERRGGRGRREKEKEHTRASPPGALVCVSLLLAVYFPTHRVDFWGSFCSVSGQSYWFQNQFDNCFIKHFKKQGRETRGDSLPSVMGLQQLIFILFCEQSLLVCVPKSEQTWVGVSAWVGLMPMSVL